MKEREQRYHEAQARWYATHAERVAMARKVFAALKRKKREIAELAELLRAVLDEDEWQDFRRALLGRKKLSR